MVQLHTSRLFLCLIATVFLSLSPSALLLGQTECPHAFFCDSLMRTYFGSLPGVSDVYYDYSVKDHYRDESGTLHLFRWINGQADLEWTVTTGGLVTFGPDSLARYRLCAEPGEMWKWRDFNGGERLMLYEGTRFFPVFGETTVCRSYLMLDAFDSLETGRSDTVATYRHILHDSLGIVAQIEVDHGRVRELQGVQCAHGFRGYSTVGISEDPYATRRDRALTIENGQIRIPPALRTGGTLRFYLYTGELISEIRLTADVESATAGQWYSPQALYLWSLASDNGKMVTGKTFTQ